LTIRGFEQREQVIIPSKTKLAMQLPPVYKKANTARLLTNTASVVKHDFIALSEDNFTKKHNLLGRQSNKA
jgi:hypothetical protein